MTGLRSPSRFTRQRGFVLAVVLLVIAIAAMVGTTAAFVSMIPRVDAAAAQRRMQSRMLAQAGLETVMASLLRQRPDLLAGLPLSPVPTGGTLFEEDQGQGITRRGIWRLRQEREGSSRSGPLRAEATGLDLNHATGPMLASAGLPESAVAKVLSLRGARRIGAWAEVASAAGGIDPARFTVFAADAAEPSVVRGTGAAPQTRVRLDRAWSKELEAELDDALGAPLMEHVRAALGKNPGFANDSALVKALLARGVKPAELALVLARCSTRSDATGIRLGRVNINHAPVEVVAAIPGFTPEIAAAVVARRAALPAEQGASPAWLLVEGVLDDEAFATAVDWIATRSLQFGLTIEAGVLVDDRASPEAEQALRDAVTLYVVIDLAGPVPRLAEVRDMTRAGDVAAVETPSPVASAAEAESPPSEGTAALPTLEPIKPLLDLEIPEREAARPERSPPPARGGRNEPAPAPSRGPGRIGRWTTGG